MNSNNRLSLCMIAKDEEACIEASLKSIHHLVDEMVVVDTGSQDDTPDLARSLGANVYYSPWKNDFAAARNASLSHATGEWILVLDADEVIDEEDHSSIMALIDNGDGDAYRLIQRTYQKVSSLAEWEPLKVDTPHSKGCKGFIPSPLVRLFRNIPSARFRGRVHELIEYDLIKQGRRIIDTDIPIHHYGKITGKERLLRKQNHYLKIGEDKILEQPSDARSFRDLGIQYIELGMYTQAESVLEKALALDNADTKITFNLAVAKAAQGKDDEAINIYKMLTDIEPNHIGAINNLAMLLQKKGGEKSQIEGFYKKALITNPNHHVLHFNYGLFLENNGDHNSAVEEYTIALKIEPHFEQAKQRLERICRDRTIKSVSPKAKLEELVISGNKFLQQEKWIAALEAFVSALEKDSLNPDLRYKCGYAMEMLGKIEQALEQYEEAMAIDPGHPETLFRLALEADRQGLGDDCIVLYEQLLLVNPAHTDALFNLACILERKGHLTSAHEHLGSLLTMIPDHADALARIKIINSKLNSLILTNTTVQSLTPSCG